MSRDEIVARGRRVIRAEREALEQAEQRLGDGFARAVEMIAGSRGRVIVAGGSEAAGWKAELIAAAGARVELYAEDPSEELRDVLARLAEAVKAEALAIAEFVRRKAAADFIDHSFEAEFGDHSRFLVLAKLDYQHGSDWLRYWWSCVVRYKERVVFSVLMDTERIHEYYDDDVDPRVRALCESLVHFVNEHGVELVGFDHPRTVEIGRAHV